MREHYAHHFLPHIAPDLELTSLSQTFGQERMVEEMVPTGRTAEFVIAAVIQFEAGKVAHEHLYWDQATLFSQLGILDHPLEAAGAGSPAQLLKFR